MKRTPGCPDFEVSEPVTAAAIARFAFCTVKAAQEAITHLEDAGVIIAVEPGEAIKIGFKARSPRAKRYRIPIEIWHTLPSAEERLAAKQKVVEMPAPDDEAEEDVRADSSPAKAGCPVGAMPGKSSPLADLGDGRQARIRRNQFDVPIAGVFSVKGTVITVDLLKTSVESNGVINSETNVDVGFGNHDVPPSYPPNGRRADGGAAGSSPDFSAVRVALAGIGVECPARLADEVQKILGVCPVSQLCATVQDRIDRGSLSGKPFKLAYLKGLASEAVAAWKTNATAMHPSDRERSARMSTHAAQMRRERGMPPMGS